jgi:casein kinase II subunit beta
VSDSVNEECVKLYCPRCEEIYESKSSRHEHIDGICFLLNRPFAPSCCTDNAVHTTGAYFGTTFPHLFFLTFPELKTTKSEEKYVPRVFGYRIHKDAHSKALEARKRSSERKKA